MVALVGLVFLSFSVEAKGSGLRRAAVGPHAEPLVRYHAHVVARFAPGDATRYFSIVEVGGNASSSHSWPREVRVMAKDSVSAFESSKALRDRAVMWMRCGPDLARLPERRPNATTSARMTPPPRASSAGEGAVGEGSDESVATATARRRLLSEALLKSGCLAGRRTLVTDYVDRGETNYAHNTAWFFDGETLHSIGGRDDLKRTNRDGVWGRAFRSASEFRSSLRRGPRREPVPLAYVLGGNQSGCIEARPGFGGRCEYDGRFSLARLGRRVFLYARANVAGLDALDTRGHFGGRFVQVAASESGPLGPFGHLGLISIQGYDTSLRQNNVYFAAVNANPVDRGHSLLGLFPVRTDDFASIAIALSCDGTHFSNLTELAATDDAGGGRTTHHPVDGITTNGSDAFFYVHADVPDINTSPTAISRIERHKVKLSHLRLYTEETKRTTKGCEGTYGTVS